MSELEFIAALVQALGWPVVVLIALLSLRRPLAGLLASMSRVRAPGGREAEFLHERMSDAEETADEITKAAATNGSEFSPRVAAMRELFDISENHPNAAILAGWRLVELQLADTLERFSIAPPRRWTARAAAEALREAGVAEDEGIWRMIEDLQAVRNVVAHGEAGDAAPEWLWESGGPRLGVRFVGTASIAVQFLEQLEPDTH